MRRGGGRIQLIYVGKEDNFLTGNPKVSFFKYIYRRHTNFTIESIRMFFNGNPDFGQRFSVTIPRFGDLLGPCFLIVDLPALTLLNGQSIGYTNSIGNALIEEMKILIGETEIDKHDGIWEYIWNNMTVSDDKKDAYNSMVGQFNANPIFTFNGPYRLHIPLTFWFNKNPGQFLPLLALQYHQIQIQFKFRKLEDLFYSTNIYNTLNCDPCNQNCKPDCDYKVNAVSLPNVELWGDYVFLGNDERRRFVSKPMDYLIEQVQIIAPYDIESSKSQHGIELVLTNPVKEIFWVFRRNLMELTHEYFNFTSLAANESGTLKDLMQNATILLDGQERFDARSSKFFRLIQPYQCHTNSPNNLYIYMYSFALRPEDIQPSGTLNASKFDSIILQVTTEICPDPITRCQRGDMKCFAYAINYNILRISNGYGGVLFSS